MRLWSLHPKYLDAKGMVALWRETLLAKKVLEGNTRGYTNHPQLERFKKCVDPLIAINYYLDIIHQEAVFRNYVFDSNKFSTGHNPACLTVTSGQLKYEGQHLLNKLKTRDPEKHDRLIRVTSFDPHPLFRIINGDVEQWEKI